MDLRIDKPEWCNDCVFGEESGCFCSLLNGELCYKHGDYEKHRPDWCPFDNDGKTITADGVTLLKEQEAVEPRVSTAEQRCGNCNKVIEMDGWKACPWCGKMID